MPARSPWLRNQASTSRPAWRCATPISWPSPTAISGTGPEGAEQAMSNHSLRSALFALPFLLVAGSGAAQAAPQILGIVASNGLPTPLSCADGYCSAYLASFCLQEARYAPNSGSEYHLAPGGRLTLLARLADGRSLRLDGADLLTIRTRSGFTTLRVSLPQSRLVALGVTSAAVEVGPGTTVLPRSYAGDPQPQTGEEVAAATGTLRRLAARTFD